MCTYETIRFEIQSINEIVDMEALIREYVLIADTSFLRTDCRAILTRLIPALQTNRRTLLIPSAVHGELTKQAEDYKNQTDDGIRSSFEARRALSMIDYMIGKGLAVITNDGNEANDTFADPQIINLVGIFATHLQRTCLLTQDYNLAENLSTQYPTQVITLKNGNYARKITRPGHFNPYLLRQTQILMTESSLLSMKALTLLEYLNSPEALDNSLHPRVSYFFESYQQQRKMLAEGEPESALKAACILTSWRLVELLTASHELISFHSGVPLERYDENEFLKTYLRNIRNENTTGRAPMPLTITQDAALYVSIMRQVNQYDTPKSERAISNRRYVHVVKLNCNANQATDSEFERQYTAFYPRKTAELMTEEDELQRRIKISAKAHALYELALSGDDLSFTPQGPDQKIASYWQSVADKNGYQADLCREQLLICHYQTALYLKNSKLMFKAAQDLIDLDLDNNRTRIELLRDTLQRKGDLEAATCIQNQLASKIPVCQQDHLSLSAKEEPEPSSEKALPTSLVVYQNKATHARPHLSAGKLIAAFAIICSAMLFGYGIAHMSQASKPALDKPTVTISNPSPSYLEPLGYLVFEVMASPDTTDFYLKNKINLIGFKADIDMIEVDQDQKYQVLLTNLCPIDDEYDRCYISIGSGAAVSGTHQFSDTTLSKPLVVMH